MLTPRVNHLLSIVGPTATGKTKVAGEINKIIPSELISADSRQVYIGMDIVTGKDHEKDIEMFGVDIVGPDQPCSVAIWEQYTVPWLDSAFHFNRLPVVIGGTGLYVKSIIEPIPTIGIPIDEKLRIELGTLTIHDLQARLRRLDPDRLYRMNNSDLNNSRRLIRAIEIAEFGKGQLREHHHDRPIISSQLMIGIAYEDNSLYKSVVKDRVHKRLGMGAVEETKKLLDKYDPSLPSMTAIGYRSIIQYLEGKFTETQMIEKWTADELNYAKRQMTWFRKVKGIIWFDAGSHDLSAEIAKYVSKWYATN